MFMQPLLHAAALALITWYLVTPPIPAIRLTDESPARAPAGNTAAPRWRVVEIFPSEKECEAHRSGRWQRCIASDDPRLKEK
jgi:hypothetical protein